MTSIKINRAFAHAGIGQWPRTREHILRNVEAGNSSDVLESMSSKQLGAVIMAAATSFADGQAFAASEQAKEAA